MCCRLGSDQADVLRWVLDRLATEQLTDEAGASSVAAHLADIMLVLTLRAYLASGSQPLSGWFS
jgi:hypothetical protein